MERIQHVNFDRILWCCNDLGVSLEDLAEATGVKLTTLEREQAGKPSLTVNQLRKLAKYFGRGILFFLETGPVTADLVHTPQFRTLNNQKSELSAKVRRLIENVERQRAVYLALTEDLDDHQIRKFVPPKLPANVIKRAAETSRKWLGIDKKQPNQFRQYRDAVEAKGILVFLSNGYAGSWQIPKDDPVCGFTLNHSVCPVIFVKKQDAEARQTFTLMHELGHLLLHRESFIDDDGDLYSFKGKEREANAFAGNLLVPDDLVKGIDAKDQALNASEYDDWLRPYRQTLGVSTEVLLRRLLDANKITTASYEAYRAWRDEQPKAAEGRGNRQYRYREPVNIFGDRFVRTVFDSLQARNISLSRASSYLDDLKIALVRKLESTYASH